MIPRDFFVLVVEDEYMLAIELRDALQKAGAAVVGPDPTVERAMSRLASGTRIDAAVLDINLSDGQIYPVADALSARNIPFVFVSGYGEDVISNRYPNAHHFYKPPDLRALLRTIEKFCNGR